MSGSDPEHGNWIEAVELTRRIGTAAAPTVIDVRRAAAIAASGRIIAGARWREHTAVQSWADELDPNAEAVLYCVHGHNVSQSTAALLRSHGLRARALRGGIDGYLQADGVTTTWQSALHNGSEPSLWVTRERPKIDRIACPWLIRRFIDPKARILYVEPDQVLPIAQEFSATAFDVDGVPYGHRDGQCSFDAFMRLCDIRDPALDHVARIVRGADTAQLELAPECAGLLALSLGVSSLHRDDLVAMEHGFAIYDALYAWARDARGEPHRRPAAGHVTGD